MGLPSTLAGIAGFIIFVIFIIGISATDIYPDETSKIVTSHNNFRAGLNATLNATSSTQSENGFWQNIFGVTGLNGIYNFIVGFMSMVVSFIVMMTQYLLLFIGISATLPTEFYVLFALLMSSSIIAIVLLIFLNGK
jgi:hypothetical protein